MELVIPGQMYLANRSLPLCHVQDEARTGITRMFFPSYSLQPPSDLLGSANVATNDVAGNFSVTLVDALDTLVVLNDTAKFEDAVRNVIDRVSFSIDTKPQVFETTIRVLGGLLSAHQFASAPGQPFYISWYRNQLLDLAYDLGNRLLPAFKTPTGIPYARVSFIIDS